jgi:hypothetical protein
VRLVDLVRKSSEPRRQHFNCPEAFFSFFFPFFFFFKKKKNVRLEMPQPQFFTRSNADYVARNQNEASLKLG